MDKVEDAPNLFGKFHRRQLGIVKKWKFGYLIMYLENGPNLAPKAAK